MNSIFIFKDELFSVDNKLFAFINNNRSKEILERHRIDFSNNKVFEADFTLCIEDSSLAIGKLLTKTEKLLILKNCKLDSDLSADTCLAFSYENFEQKQPTLSVSLICAVNRPQTNKKILQLAANTGVKQIYFLNCANTQKSYLQSKILKHENILNELTLGCEQSVSYTLPICNISYSTEALFSKLATDIDFRNSSRFICDAPLLRTTSKTDINEKPQQDLGRNNSKIDTADLKTHVFLAFGPELGWTKEEIEEFKKFDFKQFSLGIRQLRTEIAINCMLGKFI